MRPCISVIPSDVRSHIGIEMFLFSNTPRLRSGRGTLGSDFSRSTRSGSHRSFRRHGTRVTRHRRGCLDTVSAILELLLGSTVRGTSVPLTRGTFEESHAAVLPNVRFILMIGTTIPSSP